MENNSPLSPIGERQCPRCGLTFMCGMAAGAATCWCADLPNIIPLDGIVENGQTYAGCLCPNCLQTLITQRQHQTD